MKFYYIIKVKIIQILILRNIIHIYHHVVYKKLYI